MSEKEIIDRETVNILLSFDILKKNRTQLSQIKDVEQKSKLAMFEKKSQRFMTDQHRASKSDFTVLENSSIRQYNFLKRKYRELALKKGIRNDGANAVMRSDFGEFDRKTKDFPKVTGNSKFKINKFMYETWKRYQEHKNKSLFLADFRRLFKKIQLDPEGQRIDILGKLIRSCPFMKLCTFMVMEMRRWESGVYKGTTNDVEFLRFSKYIVLLENKSMLQSARNTRLNMPYHSVCHTWIHFLDSLTRESVIDPKSTWMRSVVDKRYNVRGGPFWWSMNESVINNIRGLIYYMIRNIYVLMLHAVQDIEKGKTDSISSSRVPPFMLIGKSKKFEDLIFKLIEKIVYQTEPENRRNEFVRDIEEYPGLFGTLEPDVPIIEKVWLREKYLEKDLDEPITSEQKLLLTSLFYSNHHINKNPKPITLTISDLIEIEKDMKDLYEIDGSFAMLHFLPLISIVKYLKSYITSEEIIGFTTYPFVGMSLNTLHPEKIESRIEPEQGERVDEFQRRHGFLGTARKSYFDLILTTTPYPEEYKEINEVLRKANVIHKHSLSKSRYNVFKLRWGKSKYDEALDDIFKTLKGLDVNKRNYLKILYRLFARENNPVKPKRFRVLGYIYQGSERKTVIEKGSIVTRVAQEQNYTVIPYYVEYEDERFIKWKKDERGMVPDPKKWLNRYSFHNLIENTTDFLSHFATSISVMFEILEFLGEKDIEVYRKFANFKIVVSEKKKVVVEKGGFVKVTVDNYCPVLIKLLDDTYRVGYKETKNLFRYNEDPRHGKNNYVLTDLSFDKKETIVPGRISISENEAQAIYVDLGGDFKVRKFPVYDQSRNFVAKDIAGSDLGNIPKRRAPPKNFIKYYLKK